MACQIPTPIKQERYSGVSDPINYACKMFAEMPNKKIDLRVEAPVIYDFENMASHMLDEMSQTVCAVKGE